MWRRLLSVVLVLLAVAQAPTALSLDRRRSVDCKARFTFLGTSFPLDGANGSPFAYPLFGLTASVEIVALHRLLSVEAGGATHFVPLSEEGKYDGQLFVRVGPAWMLYDGRDRREEGYVLQVDTLAGYHYVRATRGVAEGAYVTAKSHSIGVLVGVDQTWWTSRNFGIVLRLSVTTVFPVVTVYSDAAEPGDAPGFDWLIAPQATIGFAFTLGSDPND